MDDFEQLYYTSTEDHITWNEEKNELYEVLQQLKRSYREVILLRKIQEFSVRGNSRSSRLVRIQSENDHTKSYGKAEKEAGRKGPVA
ncbi:hypothetical protein [Alteribacter natronophilus]|uniref:hypothetical protein n=1 Tax=Alteribacter natronophilus TaxID=2583810 RepID=UPI00110DB276|nr:hypothetical protein [Alteribacter natronophilus]TMW70314.1 hypothetical protein FGB90_16700 [Alteribacter natronophilus]